MKIIIGADLVPTYSNEKEFIDGDIISLLGEELYKICKNADVRIFNLEVPLTNKLNPIDKCGPNLFARTDTINGIKKLNPTLLTLANNHILDQGESGLQSTKDILNEYDIPFIGVGDNVYEASKPYIIEYNKFKIGVYACTDHEFTIATNKSMGANPFDALETLDHITSLKEVCDYVIILYHGGKEHYRYPSPYLQKICRKMVDKGANLVVCQHSHCIGSMEEYKEATIVYGQGNFLFDDSDCEFWSTGLLLEIEIGNKLSVNYIPLCKEGNGVRLATGNLKVEILEKFNNRSLQIRSNDFIEEEYKKFSYENKQKYLMALCGYNRVSRKLNKLLNNKLINIKYSKKKLLVLKNYIECDAHREIILNAID